MTLVHTVSLATVLLVVIATASVDGSLKASDYFNVCCTEDPKLNDCVKNVINDLRPKLVAGIPELGVASHDPYHVDRMELKGKFALMEFSQVLTNLVLVGLGSYETLEVKFDPKALTLYLKELVPSLNATAHYVHEGPLAFMAKEGEVSYHLKGLKMDIDMGFEVKDVGGIEVLQVNDFKWSWDIEDCDASISNLDVSKAGVFARFVDQLKDLGRNLKLGFKMFKYLPEREFGVLLKDSVNKMLAHFPAAELLPKKL